MKSRRKCTFKGQVLRGLTLVCFFHFSGLNNGFAGFVISSHNAQNLGFAPMMVKACVSVLNPINWKKFIFQPLKSRILKRSSEVVEVASQRVMQRLLVESSVFQIWLQDTCRKALEKSRLNSSLEGRVFQVAEGNAACQEGSHLNGENFRSNPSHRVLLAAFSSRENNTHSLHQYGMRDPPETLSLGRKKCWRKDRFHFWDSLKWESPTYFLHDPLRDRGRPNSSKIGKAKRAVRPVDQWLWARLLYFTDKGEEDPSVGPILSDQRFCESSQSFGMIFFCAGRNV